MKMFVLMMALVSGVAFAEEENKAVVFEDAKSMLLKSLDLRIANLQEAKGCISQASNKDAMKVCHDKLKSDNKAVRESLKGERQGLKEKRKGMREQRRKK